MYGRQDTFKTDVFVVDEPVIYIPNFIHSVCNTIQSRFVGKEFSILVKGKWKSDGFHLSNEYIIPKQKVSPGAVDYEPLAEYVARGYNAVIHSHHDLGCDTFSSTDLEYINSFFPVSILYSRGRFTTAHVNYNIEGGFARYKASVKTFLDAAIVVRGLENITDYNFQTYDGMIKTFKNIFIPDKTLGKVPDKKIEKPIELKKEPEKIELKTG